VLSLLLAKSFEITAELFVRKREDRHRKESGVFRASFADCQSSDWNDTGQLRYRQERVEALELRLNRYAENRQPRMSCNYSSQVCRTACAGDDDSQSMIRCFSREICRGVWSAMSRQHPRFVRHTERI